MPHTLPKSRLRFEHVQVSPPGQIPGLPPPRLSKTRTKPAWYSGRRSYVRGDLRTHFDQELQRLSGDPKAGMFWTFEDYIESVVLKHGHKLIGWPCDIPFGNLSYVHGGVDVLTRLDTLWTSGALKFIPITEDERIAASVDPYQLAPAPKCAHRKSQGGREDIGCARPRPKTNPYNLALRHPKNGPKTPKYVPAEWDE
ncbi:hypothetical protein BD309DRAFT_975054 [Dichomitus squalens]|uniref:Uncharacterized protein n=1 Tax=Dichomitus squalens TaxID=114155 RepID=A0A4Q9NBN7_9APHY|nr:hypothetical protein BD309DRAFT_975054 [Dichomitus squalens]TBU51739.1 hypothetical protein BD310DRAFT_862913 [Dichomitus squalens]